jgi:HNH endonuclease
MKTSSGFSKCTICLKDNELTYEHIIPKSIGGFFEADLQCADCNNNKLGAKLLPKAKKIFTVRMAIRALKKKLPDLYKSIEEGQEYTAKSSDNSVAVALYKKGKIVSKANKDEKGALNVDKKDTEQSLTNILKKEGFSESKIQEKLELLKNHKIDEPLQISNLTTVIKRKFISLFPKVGVVEMDNRIIALIAYNYLCITIGETIFNERFNGVREFILNGTISENISIEQFPYNGPYKSYHKIYRESLEDRTKVTIILFGTIVYMISFLNIKIVSDDNLIIIQDLEEKKLYSAITIEEEKKGYYILN